jgi:hypothetical protein
LGGNVTTVGRLNSVARRDMQAWEPRDWPSAQEAAQGIILSCAPGGYSTRIDAWETFNEFSALGRGFTQGHDGLAEADGFKLVLYAFSVAIRLDC